MSSKSKRSIERCGKNHFDRRENSKKPNETVCILTEGQTEQSYLKKFLQENRIGTVTVFVAKHPSPINIVEEAIRLLQSTDYDLIFCVFDQDQHESYERALIKLSNYPNITPITSIPCFEIWLLLHFDYSTKSYVACGKYSAGDRLRKDLKKYLPEYDKGSKTLWYNLVNEKLQKALIHAEKLSEYNQITGELNPSTNMDKLIGHLVEISQR